MVDVGLAAFPHVRVRGSPRELGRQYGGLARERIERGIMAYADIFKHYAGWDWPAVRAKAREYAAPIHDFQPKFMEEITGIAEGARVTLDDILALNVRTEIMFAAKTREAESGRVANGQCSSFAALPPVTQIGHVLIGQNWDWMITSRYDTVVVLEAAQDEGPDFVTVVEAGLLAKLGFNSSGVGLVTNALTTDDDQGAPGVPFHVILRAILDCDSISDALGVIQRGRRSSSANYLMAQEDGLAICVEAMPGDYSRVRLLLPEDGLIFHTNHFLSRRFDRKDTSLWLYPDSPFRLERLRSVMMESQPVTIAGAKLALTDHVNYPHSVCGHPDERLPKAEQLATVTSVVMDLNARLMWLSNGAPCAVGYQEVDYSEFLEKGSPLRNGRAEATSSLTTASLAGET